MRSAETSAEIVWPVGLVISHAPFSLATTPGRTASVTMSRRMTSPRSFHTRTWLPWVRLALRRVGRVHQQRRRLPRSLEVAEGRGDALVGGRRDQPQGIGDLMLPPARQ